LLCLSLQEVTRQLPKSAHYRSILSKQWTDCTYLDVSPAQEQLSDDSRRRFNITALEHAKQVMPPTHASAQGLHSARHHSPLGIMYAVFMQHVLIPATGHQHCKLVFAPTTFKHCPVKATQVIMTLPSAHELIHTIVLC